MQSIKVGATDLQVSRIGYGCSSLGGWSPGPLSSDQAAYADRIIHAATDCGVTFFDFADIYGQGKAEEAMGGVLRASPSLRDRIVLQTKCGQTTGAGWSLGKPIGIDLSARHIKLSAEQSLKRLGVETIDIFMLHVPDALMEPEEVAAAFDDLCASGKVRQFGASNYNAAQLALLSKFVRQPIVANQLQLGLGHPQVLADGLEISLAISRGDMKLRRSVGMSGAGVVDFCRLNDIQIQAWSPLKGGLLDAATAGPESRLAAQLVANLAAEKGTTPAGILLAWLIRHPAGIVPFVNTSNPDHLREACAAVAIPLSSLEWYELLNARSHVLPQGL